MAWIDGLTGALIGLLTSLATLAVLAVAIPLVGQGELDGVYLAVLALAVMASFEAISALPFAFQYLEKSLEAGERLFEIVDAEPAVTGPPPPYPIPENHGLCVRDLRFRYRADEVLALDGKAVRSAALVD